MAETGRGKIHVDVDSSFDIDSGTGGTGAIIRDHNCGFITAGQCYLTNAFDAPMAEALALRDGILFARQMSCNRITVQSDCLQVVQSMKGGVLRYGSNCHL